LLRPPKDEPGVNRNSLQSVLYASKKIRNGRSPEPTNEVRVHTHPDRRSDHSISSPLARGDPRAPPTYPFLAYSSVKDRSEISSSPARTGPTTDLALMCAKEGAELGTYSRPYRLARGNQAPRRGGAGI
jgi:hypothetical protein